MVVISTVTEVPSSRLLVEKSLTSKFNVARSSGSLRTGSELSASVNVETLKVPSPALTYLRVSR